MTQLMDSQQSVPAAGVPRRKPRRSPFDGEAASFVLAIDLGSGALKVGAVSLTGEIAAVAQRDYETERLPGGGADPGRRGLVGAWSASWPRSVLKGDSGRAGRRGLLHRPVGEHRSRRRGGRAGRPLRDVARHPRRAALARASIGGPLMGYSPRALATWIRHTGGVPSPFGGDPVSHMLHLERDEPDDRRGRALVPGAGRLPDHAVHRTGGGDPRLDERRLADRQPAPRPAGLRPDARRQARARRRQAAAAGRRPAR